MVGSAAWLRRVAALAACAALAGSAAAPALAQPAGQAPEGPVTLTADHIEYDTQAGDVLAEGHVKATRGDTTITADRLTGNLRSGLVHATGHVALTQPGRTATGEALTYNYRTRVGEMTQAVATYPPWTATGRTFTTQAGQGVVTGATITPCDPTRPALLVRSRRVVIVPEDYLTAYDSILYVYGIPVAYVPTYTTSLRPGSAQSGPTVGYDNFNGVWAEYTQYMRFGEVQNALRVRYGTRSGWSGEDIASERIGDHLLSVHLGRTVIFDQNGTQFNLDQYSFDAYNDYTGVGTLPLRYATEAHVGSYQESQSGVNSARVEGLFTLSTETFRLTPRLTIAGSGYYRYDAYGVGPTRTITAASAALTQILTSNSSATLSYNFATLHGATPFSFDGIGADSTISLGYGYYPGGFFQSGSISIAYNYLTQETTGSLSVALLVSQSVAFGANIAYSFTSQQLTEIDYVVSATCDCLSLGVLYRTFPNSPASNQWFVTLGINKLPGFSTTVQVGGPK